MIRKEFVEAAIRAVRATYPVNSPEAWSSFESARKEQIFALETKVLGNLCSFENIPDVNRNGRFLLEAKTKIPFEAVYLSNLLWNWIGGDKSPEWGTAAIAAACIEFTRCQFDSLLVGIAFAEDESQIRAHVQGRAKATPELMHSRPWGDADAIARAPQASVWFNQSAAADFNEWLYLLLPGTDTEQLAYEAREPQSLMKPVPSEAVFRAAIALVWLDEAVLHPEKAMALMAGVADIAADCGFVQGWNGRGEMDADEKLSFAHLGANARHAGNRATRAALIEAYREGRFPSKDAAASELSARFSVGWRTARDY